MGHGVFHLQVFLGKRFSILDSGQVQDLHEEGLVAIVQGLVLFLQVIVTVSHAQAALAHVEDLDIAVGKIGLDSGAQEAAFSVEVHFAQESGQLVTGLHGLDFRDVGLDRLGAQGIAGGGIQGHFVEVGDFLIHGAFLGFQGGHALEEGVEVFLGAFGDGVEAAVAGELRTEGVIGLPAAGGVLVEIHLGTGLGVQIGQIQCRDRAFGSTGCKSKE